MAVRYLPHAIEAMERRGISPEWVADTLANPDWTEPDPSHPDRTRSYDPEADAMFIWLAPEGATSAETREVSPGVMLDYDSTGRLIGIEILNVGGRAADHAPGRIAAE